MNASRSTADALQEQVSAVGAGCRGWSGCGCPASGWPSRGCPVEVVHRQMALPEFIATASCLLESSHVGDVLLYGQLTLIVIVCLKHSKTTVGKKKKSPLHLDGPFPPSPASLFVQ